MNCLHIPEGVTGSPMEDDIMTWCAVIFGPGGYNKDTDSLLGYIKCSNANTM